MKAFRTVRGAALAAAALLTACTSGGQHGGPPPPHGSGRCQAIAGSGRIDPAATVDHPTTVPTRQDAVDVDLAHELGPTNPNLLGLVWNTGDNLAPVAPIHPPTIRVDASLQDASTGPDQLDLSRLLARVAEIRSVGAEPLVLLSYMPRWLGQPRAGADDPTRYAPYDLDAWQGLVTKVVRTLATAKAPAYWFEVWNEPDIPIFWKDTTDAFIDTALRTQQAVADVKRETGLPLEVGGPASAFGVPAWLGTWLQRSAAARLPVDFVSWHKYANSPYLGPDGPEGNLDPAIYQALAKRNPDTTPLDYATEIAQVRAKVDAAWSGGPPPKLFIDEWNVSAGGYDLRNDDAEGASLDAGILIEMEQAGLDGADFYRAISGSDGHPGDWGMVTADGTPKPSWWVFRAWRAALGIRLVTSGADAASGLWARATRERQGCIDLLLTNFVATGSPARQVHVHFDGALPWCGGRPAATLDTLDQTSTTLDHGQPIQLRANQDVTVGMQPQSVALVRVGCSTARGAPQRTAAAGTATGARGHD